SAASGHDFEHAVAVQIDGNRTVCGRAHLGVEAELRAGFGIEYAVCEHDFHIAVGIQIGQRRAVPAYGEGFGGVPHHGPAGVDIVKRDQSTCGIDGDDFVFAVAVDVANGDGRCADDVFF